MLQPTASTTSELIAPMDLKGSISERVRGEYREMPGLALTLAQARRLWSLDAPTCSEVLSHLVDSGFLCQRVDGAFCRRTDFADRPVRAVVHA